MYSFDKLSLYILAVYYPKGWIGTVVPTRSAVQIHRAAVKNLERESERVILTSPVVSLSAFCQGLSPECFEISRE